MKKISIVCMGLCAALALTSCGSSKESAYKKAYEKAKAQEQANSTGYVQAPTPVAAPVNESYNQGGLADSREVANATVRQESVTVVNGAGLRDYSVVVGSFGVRANAEGLQSKLKGAGYDAQVAYNSSLGMYRVVATTYASKADAVHSRNQLRATYPDAWLLYKK